MSNQNINYFQKSLFSTEDKIKNFTKYVPRKFLTRFLVQHELFKKQLSIKGSIVECGVHQGGGLFAWGKLSSIYEPYNYHRKIYGFDTFNGFPSIERSKDNSKKAYVKNFAEKVDIVKDIDLMTKLFDSERIIKNKKKIELIKGDANLTIPKFIKKNNHILISLLYLDFDIYKPTKTALKLFFDRIPKGGIIAFDELNNPDWPGETLAMLEEIDIKKHRIENFPFEPNISYIVK